MKKILYAITALALLFITNTVSSQACSGGNGPSVCTPQGGPAGGGFEDANSTPCIEQGTAYSHAIQFTMFSVFEFLGTQDVDSIQFLTIENLPCGMCWAVDQTDKTYSANEDGCLSITGTTNDPAGQYKMALSLKAWINGIASGQTIPATLVDQTGIKLLLRVKTAAGNCPSADTSSSANNLTASTGCPVGINDIERDINLFETSPNPMTTTLNVSFTSIENNTYTLKLQDVTGRIVYSEVVTAVAGQNSYMIPRNGLSGGLYIVSVSNESNSISHRIQIAE